MPLRGSRAYGPSRDQPGPGSCACERQLKLHVAERITEGVVVLMGGAMKKLARSVMVNTRTWLLICLPPLIVLIIHKVLFSVIGLYESCPAQSIPTHFVGGAAISFSLIVLHKALRQSGLIPEMTTMLSVFFIFTTISTVAVWWEFAEYALDAVVGTQCQVSLEDTMLDMLVGSGGGLSVLLFFKLINRRIALRI